MFEIRNVRAEMYRRHRGMVPSLAWKFAQRDGLPLHDLLDVGQSALADQLMRLEKWNRSRCGPSTFSWQGIYWGLKNHCRKVAKQEATRKTHQYREGLENGEVYLSRIPKSKPRRFLEAVSGDAEVLMRLVLRPPKGLRQHLTLRAPVRAKKVIYTHLMALGWDEPRIDTAWIGVQLALETTP